MVIAIVLLTVAAGFCLFDQDDHGAAGHQVPDLCLGMLAASVTVLPFVGLLAVGWTVNPPAVAAYVVGRHVPEPPPRSALFR